MPDIDQGVAFFRNLPFGHSLLHFGGIHAFAVILHHNMQHGLLQRNPHLNAAAAPPVREPVLDAVLHKRLQQYFGNGEGQKLLLFGFGMILEQILIAFLLDGAILLHMRELVLQRNQILAAAKPQLEHLRQCEDHLVDIIIFAHHRFAIDCIQRVVQKMWLHLRGQRPDLRMAFAFFLLAHIFDQRFDLRHHPVELESDLGDLVVIFTLKRNAELVLLHPAHQPAQLEQGPEQCSRQLVREKPRRQQKNKNHIQNRPLHTLELSQHLILGLHPGENPVRCNRRLLIVDQIILTVKRIKEIALAVRRAVLQKFRVLWGLPLGRPACLHYRLSFRIQKQIFPVIPGRALAKQRGDLVFLEIDHYEDVGDRRMLINSPHDKRHHPLAAGEQPVVMAFGPVAAGAFFAVVVQLRAVERIILRTDLGGGIKVADRRGYKNVLNHRLIEGSLRENVLHFG
ncbi:hypothetical protein D3C75_610280 [compost metagenome]